MEKDLKKNLVDKVDDTFTILVVGDKGVGKTSVLKKLTLSDETEFEERSKRKSIPPTNNFTKQFKVGSEKYLFKIWDINYSDINSFTVKYSQIAKKADAVIIVCASDNKKSFFSIKEWESVLKDNMEISKKIYLIFNEIDNDEWAIGIDELKQQCDQMNITFYECSAQSGKGIEKAFNNIFNNVKKRVYKTPTGEDDFEKFEVGENETKKETGLCAKCCSKCTIY